MTDPANPFGDPAGIQALSQKLEHTGTELEQLRQTLNRAAQGVYPDLWHGRAGEAFGANLQQQLDAVSRLGQLTTSQASTLSTLSMALAEARFDFEQARIFCMSNGLIITPELRVFPVNPTDPHAGAMARMMQSQIDLIKYNAELAVRQAAGGNQAAIEETLELTGVLLHLIPLEGQIAALIARLRQLVRIGRTGTEVDRWSAAEQDLARRQRVIDQQTDNLWRDFENQRSDRYRQEVAQLQGPAPTGAQAHHNFPVEFSGKFQQLGIDTKNPAWGSWVDGSQHSALTPDLRQDWSSFFNSPQMQQATQLGADPATIAQGRSDAFDFARAMGNKYGYQVPF
jgi:uncharacterized protein YukE